MNRTTFSYSSFAAALLIGSQGFAADATTSGLPSGLYGGAAAAIVDATDSSASGASGGSVKFDNGLGGAVFIGNRFDGGWRGEIELARRSVDLSSVANTAGRGDATADSLMGNAVLDLDVGSAIKPYVGAGAGFARVKLSNAAPFGGSTISGSDTVGAAQAIAGASYPLSDTIEAFADYRYFTTQDADFTTAAGVATSMDLSTHSLMAGVRVAFGGSASSSQALHGGADINDRSGATMGASADPSDEGTVVAEQAALPSRTLPDSYMVHFVLNKADVTPEGIAVIERAAANARTMKVTRLELTGHTDRAGEEGYNLSLSKRRAEAVRQAFVALGFDETEISVKAKGETSLLVPTIDGKHEPQNRRVEIVLP